MLLNMVSFENVLWTILWVIIVIVVSALPLYLAVTFLGGRTSILKTFLVMIITALVVSMVSATIPFGGIIAFILLIWIYKEMFQMGWLRAFLAWILQIVFIIVLFALLAVFGIGTSEFFFGRTFI